jgi:hypothetical protein
MKVIIAGCRDFNNYDLLKSKLDFYFSNIEVTEIVSGACSGADKLGERYALEHNIPVKQFPANWNLGRKAGPLRNEEMASYADALVAFWDLESRGTKDMINRAEKHNLKIRVVVIKENR